MLAKQQTIVRAILVAPCLACCGSGFARLGYSTSYCVPCKGAGKFELPVTEPTVEEVDAWSDCVAWDAVAEKVLAAGAEIDDDAGSYEILKREHNGNSYTVTLKIKPPTVSAETAAFYNALVSLVRK